MNKIVNSRNGVVFISGFHFAVWGDVLDYGWTYIGNDASFQNGGFGSTYLDAYKAAWGPSRNDQNQANKHLLSLKHLCKFNNFGIIYQNKGCQEKLTKLIRVHPILVNAQ